MLQYDLVKLDDSMIFFQELVVVPARDVRQLCSRAIPMIKAQWHHHPIEEATWELEVDMRE